MDRLWKISTLVFTAIYFLLLPCCNLSPDSSAKLPLAPPATMPSLTAHIPWTGETYHIPPPALIPDAFKNSLTYRYWWSMKKDIETFRIPLANGRTLVADAWGGVIANGHQMPSIPYMKIYRPDGTLELSQFNQENLNPVEWTLYAPDGTTPTLYVVNRISGIENVPYIEQIIFYKNGKPNHQFDLNSTGTVEYDMQLHDDGSVVAVLHPTKQETAR